MCTDVHVTSDLATNQSVWQDNIRYSSRIAGLYRLPPDQRLTEVLANCEISDGAESFLREGGYLPITTADRLSENVVACHTLPLSIATNFLINGQDVLIPMAVEEPSIVAAASNAARLVRQCGGFSAWASPSIMTTQVQFDGVPEPHQAVELIMSRRAEVLAMGDSAIPRMIARGGGCRDINGKVLDEKEGIVCFYVHVDVGNAMGANIVDSVAERLAPFIHEWIGGHIGLRILTNLPLHRMVKSTCALNFEALGGAEIAAGIARASRFAELDVMRAVTHNKGIMNGIDAAGMAFGQDWRSVEAAAHAYAGMSSGYRPLARWHVEGETLMGVLEMPMAVGTAGGLMNVHPGVQAAFEIARISDAQQLAMVMASAGLASNLSALKALSGEGIQKGHMRLHHRKRELEATAGESHANRT